MFWSIYSVNHLNSHQFISQETIWSCNISLH